MEKTDRRILRTQKLITDALLTLLMEKKFNDIIIQEISDRANVGRATFYLHYASKEACLIKLLTQGFDSLVAEIESDLSGPEKDLISNVEKIFIHTANHRKLYLALLGDAQSANVLTDIQHYIKTKMLDMILAPPNFDSNLQQAMATYLTGALLSLLIWWLAEEPALSAREAAGLFVGMSQNGLLQYR